MLIYPKIKKPCKNYKVWCPGQDSNLHAFDGASPSSWCVYQFHHLGNNNWELTNAKIAYFFKFLPHQGDIFGVFVIKVHHGVNLVPRTGLEPAHHC